MARSEKANELIKLAGTDFKAAIALSENDSEFESVVGFHLQQAAEKLLKAWLEILQVEFPKTHDLTLLLSLLENHNCNVDKWWDLLTLMPYAVNLRYEEVIEHYPDMGKLFDVISELKDTINQL